MTATRAVVDGSNIATEGRNQPSLHQLDEAVRAFKHEYPDLEVTVVVDATFGHRIPESERAEFDEAIEHGELTAAPAGGVGRGDAFILQLAERHDMLVFSNDSFQEFHGEHDWLFERGRLIGGKPIPGLGWHFQDRVPVRGPKSRQAIRDARGGGRRGRRSSGDGDGARPSGSRGSTKSAAKSSAKSKAPAKARGAAKPAGKTPAKTTSRRSDDRSSRSTGDGGGGSGRRSRRSRRSGAPTEPVNAPLVFIEFAQKHPPGSEVEVNIVEYSSHGAYGECEGARCYVPTKLLGDPAPSKARDALDKGSTYPLVVHKLNAELRSIEVGLPGVAGPAGSALPIDDYDAKDARALLGELGELDRDDLERVLSYEQGGKARVTILNRIESLMDEASEGGAADGSDGEASTEVIDVDQPAEEKHMAKKKAAKKSPPTKKKVAAKKKAAAKRAPARKAPAKKKAAAKRKAAPKKKAAAKRAPARKAPARKAPAKKKAAAKKKPAARRR